MEPAAGTPRLVFRLSGTGSSGATEQGRRAELRLTEMEQRLELEATNRQRLEGQVSRLREARDRLEKVRLHSSLIRYGCIFLSVSQSVCYT